MSNPQKLRLVFCVALAGCWFCHAVSASNSDYLIDTWDASSGLPQSTVTAITQTADGYLWVGTENGLARFDGAQFLVWNHNGPAALKNASVNRLFLDKQNNLWISLAGCGVVWNGQRFSDAQWPLTAGDRVDQLLSSSSNMLALYTLQGRLLLGTNFPDGRWCWTNAATLPPPSASPRPLLKDFAGNSWFNQPDGGLLRLGHDGLATRLTAQDGLPGNRVLCMFQDREGNLWAGVDRGGLVRLREKRFQILGTAEGLANPAVLSVCEDLDGTIWAGTYGGGLNRWAKGKFTAFDFGVDGSKGEVFAVFPDRQGRLWIGTGNNGVFILNRDVFSRPFPADSIPGKVQVIFEDRGGTIWFGSTAGIYYWSWQQNKLDHFGAETVFASANACAFAEGLDGVIWAGTRSSGLLQIKGGKAAALHVRDGLPEESVQTLLADADGTVWIGMYGGGLIRWKNGALARCAPSEDLPDDVICHLSDDGAGWLWISSPHGLFRVAKADLHAFADGRKKSVACTAYGKFDGLPAMEFSGGTQPCGWNAADGRLWFATIKGLVSFRPNLGTVNSLPPPVVVESLSVNGELFAASVGVGGAVKDLRDGLEIPAGQTRVEFKFTALSFTAPDKVRFQYRLKGLENDWVDGGMNRSAAYSYLSPGRYEFRVRAANNDGVWNETGAAISFRVLPNFWQTGWFRLMAIVMLGTFVWIALYVRMSRLRALERLRLRIARDLHDDVGANLASMSLLSETMSKKPSVGDAEELRRIARVTIDSLRDIVWFIDPAHETLADLVLRMRQSAAALLPGLHVNFQVDVPNPNRELPLEFRRNVFPVFKEILHNVARHAQASSVNIRLDCRGAKFCLTIEDDGVGFDDKRVALGNGLHNMRTRSEELAGTVRIVSVSGKKTSVEYEVPLP